MFKLILSTVLSFAVSSILFGIELVSEKDIKNSKEKTSIFNLSNGIPVIYRNEPSSDIVHISVSFDWALKDQNQGTKSLPGLTTALMTKGSYKYPQKKLYEIIEKYSLGISCSSSIDTSTCNFETINDYFEKTIDVLSSSITTPEFGEKDFKNTKEKMISSNKAEMEDPDSSVNEAVNKIYYEETHPYVLPPEKAIEELNKFKLNDIKSAHKSMLNAKRMSIAVVTSLDQKEIKKILEKEFSKIKSWNYSKSTTAYPKSSKKRLSLVEREIPTSYIKIKVPTPNLTSKDAAASLLLFEILSEEMATEIRTKRSLSYAAYAYTGQGQLGLGVFAVSTPKPKETLIVLADIISKIKTKEIPSDIFEEYKRTFSTGHFLRQETHASIASILLRSLYYTGGTDFAYETPKSLGEVSPKEVKDLANKILKDFKIGVLGNKKQIHANLGKILEK